MVSFTHRPLQPGAELSDCVGPTDGLDTVEKGQVFQSNPQSVAIPTEQFDTLCLAWHAFGWRLKMSKGLNYSLRYYMITEREEMYGAPKNKASGCYLWSMYKLCRRLKTYKASKLASNQPNKNKQINKQKPWLWVSKRTISAARPPLVGEITAIFWG